MYDSVIFQQGGIAIKQEDILERALSLPSQRQVIPVPRELACDQAIDARAKSLYVQLHMYKPRSLRELASRTGLNRRVVSRLITSLIEKQWVIMKPLGNRHVIIPTLPPRVQKAKLDYMRECLRMSPRAGEFKMKLRFAQIIDASPWVDNVRPWFLQSSESGEFLEYDRYCPHAKIAGEFQGRQHFETTSEFPGPDELEKRKARDSLKEELSRKHDVVLITIRPEDLLLENMLKRIPETVPIKLIDLDGPYARGLEELCQQYIAYHRRGRARDIRKGR
jgi:hypothetical protein